MKKLEYYTFVRNHYKKNAVIKKLKTSTKLKNNETVQLYVHIDCICICIIYYKWSSSKNR